MAKFLAGQQIDFTTVSDRFLFDANHPVESLVRFWAASADASGAPSGDHWAGKQGTIARRVQEILAQDLSGRPADPWAFSVTQQDGAERNWIIDPQQNVIQVSYWKEGQDVQVFQWSPVFQKFQSIANSTEYLDDRGVYVIGTQLADASGGNVPERRIYADGTLAIIEDARVAYSYPDGSTELLTADRTSYTSADTLTTRIVWPDGLQTVEYTGESAYQSTIVNGGELRFYTDGRVSFATAADGESFVDPSAPGFDWESVPGYGETWDGAGRVIGLGAESWAVSVDDGINSPVLVVDGARWETQAVDNSATGFVGYQMSDALLAEIAGLEVLPPSSDSQSAVVEGLLGRAGVADDGVALSTGDDPADLPAADAYADWAENRAAATDGEVSAVQADTIIALSSDPGTLALQDLPMALGAIGGAVGHPSADAVLARLIGRHLARAKLGQPWKKTAA